MPNLHVHYYHGNVKQFRQELDGTAGQGAGSGASASRTGGPLSVSGGKSWSLSGFTSAPVGKGDPNERDAFGRTVLHLAASSLAPQAYTFFGILLRNPQIAVNLQDYESGYTALHRALFAGNIRAARDLLARNDVDLGVKDSEGLTAFELYNGTVEGTSPPPPSPAGQGAEVGTDLFVWGVNRNFALGTGDSSDKAYPDHVNLLTQSQAAGKADPVQRFFHVGVRDVVMSKLHTGVITDEARGNLSICGFGSNGRLGRSVHSQLALLPMSDLPHTITSIALAQDHTLALTSGGYILSWGHNRFAQLGYVIDAPDKPVIGLGKDEVEVQVSPRRIVGPLKKEYVRGVAAGRMASACWTADAVWTWGTNAGHLGYDKAANPVQILPRKVTAITQTVIDVALSDFAMICLLDSNEVLCFHHDANFKISFQVPRVLSDASSFRPAESRNRPMITKITSSGQTFAALSSIGDVFTFSLPNPLEDVSKDARDRHVTVKPQLIWALRKRFDAVRDMAIGSDGTVIICTSSGHVFVRQRVKSGSGQLKFRRIPYLQRVIKVACNESGAFAAIRVDGKPRPIDLKGRTLEEDLNLLQPHMQRLEHQMTAADFARLSGIRTAAAEDEEEEAEGSVSHDIAIATRLCTVLSRWGTSDEDTLFSWSEPLMGSDVHLVVGDHAIPAHSTILKLRSPAFDRMMNGRKLDRFAYDSASRGLEMTASHPLTALLLLQYIYSDEIACVWDPRVARTLQDKFADLKLPIGDIKADLRALADVLGFSPLAAVLQATSKIAIPNMALSGDLGAFFAQTSGTTLVSGSAQSQADETDCDITLVLADKQVSCSSVILRSRCQFFEAMFADGEWVRSRGDAEGKVVVDMSHLRWRPMKLVFRWIHEGKEDDLFDYLHQETMDEFLDFVFEVLAAATELLIDRLVLVCSRVIIRHCNAYNAAALAVEASFYQATTLKESIFDYISSCLETMLESGLLDDMDDDVLQNLCDDIAKKQSIKLPVARQQILLKPLMAKHKDWLALQDIPVPRIRQPIRWKPRSPALSPVDLTPPAKRKDKEKDRRASPSPVLSPIATPITAHDDIFAMDDESSSPSVSGSQTPRTRPMTPLDITGGSLGRQGGAVWKSRTVEAEKVDLRSIMAETAATKTPTRPAITSTPSGLANRQTPATAQRSPSLLPLTTPSKAGPPRSAPLGIGSSPAAGGPWRPVEARRTSLATVQTQQSTLTSSAPATAPLLTRAPGSQASPAPIGTGASRVITPAKAPYLPSTTRKASGSGAAWATVPSFASPPLPPPTQASPGSVGQAFSLLAIQQQEQEHLDRSNQKRPTKSFAEIQEEEQRAEAARAKQREEDDFARWWNDEQARLSKDAGGDGRGRGRGRGQKRVPHGDRGRGRGGKAPAGQENGHEEAAAPTPSSRGGRGGKPKTSPTTRRSAQQQQSPPVREIQSQHQSSSNNQVTSVSRA